MDENLPEKTPDADLSPVNGGSAATGRELAVSGGEVYLPASATVKPGDEKFREIVSEVLPEVAPSLSDNALGRSRGYSVAAVLLILVFLCAVFVALWHLVPRPEKLTCTVIGIPEPGQDIYKGRFGTEFGKAQEHIKNKKFNAAREILEPIVDKLLKDGVPTAADDNIFFTYFSLFDRLAWSDGARARLAKLGKLAPDEYRWQLFDILSHPALARFNGEFQNPDDGKLDFNSKSIIVRMKKIDSLRRRRPELARQLDLYKCYLDLNLWRLKNHEEKSARVGVEDREEALKIAKKYANNLDFLKVRRYIVVQMLNDSSGNFIARYKFDGNVYYSKTRLFEELGVLQKKLKKH